MSESLPPNASPASADPSADAPATRQAAGRARKAPRPRGARARVGARSRRSARTTSSAPVLGVHVTPSALHAVLMRPTSDGYEPVRQFSRQRSLSADGPTAAEHAPLPSLAGATPGSAPADDGVTIQFGDGSGASDLFLDSEFASLGVAEDIALDAASLPKKLGAPIVFELKDLLEECGAAGFDRPALAFVIGAPDVDYVEVTVPSDDAGRKKDPRPEPKAQGKKDQPTKVEKAPDPKAATAPVKRERLMGLLPKMDVAYDRERVAFVPMTPRESLRRYLAILPRPEEPVADSLELLREQQGMRRVGFRTLTAEVPMLIGMARYAFPTDPHENTAIVRVGTEDTLVILLQGDQLHHCDHMRSVTTFDGPDTICSRVLLQQDVQGVGTVHNVIVISEEREEELVQGFSAFYPEARVETLRAGMAKAGLSGPYGPLPTQAMEPAGAALQALIRRESPFEDVNLLPKALRRRAKAVDVSFSWHTAVVGVLLFLSVLFFVGLYFKQQSDIAEAEQRLAALPPQATMTGPQLQARIDSLRAAQAQITTSLAVLDSLLYGTDRWSQTLALTTTAAAGTGNIWLEDWTPAESDLVVHGFSTNRDAVVRLAGRLNASIEELFFREIREHPVYEYRLRYSLPFELPAAIRYLREQAGEAIPAPPPPPEPLAGTVPLAPQPRPAPTAAPPPAADAAPPTAEPAPAAGQ